MRSSRPIPTIPSRSLNRPSLLAALRNTGKQATAWAGGLLALSSLWLPATSAGAADAADDSVLQEVIVTANRRTEDTKDVPISIGVIDAQQIQDLHVDGYEDISRLLAGISFAAHNNGPNGPGQDNITIRGVSSTVGNPTVATYIDDVPLITFTGYEGDTEPRLIDIERVEVLRGPQGTLYGASSEGGTVRYITNQPDAGSFSGYLRQDYSGTEFGGFNFDERGVLNIPVVEDVFAVRLSAEYGKQSGYINNYALEGSLADGTASAGPLQRRGVNNETDAVVRLVGKWTLSEDFTVTPSVLYQSVSTGATSTFLPQYGTYNQNFQVPSPDNDSLLLPTLTIKKGLGFADLNSVTSYLYRKVDRQTDGTFYNTTAIVQSVLDPATTLPYTAHTAQNNDILGNVPSPVYFRDNFNTWTQELRLSSPADASRVKWVAGLFYADEEWTHLDYEPAPGFSAAFQNIYGYSIDQDPLLNPTLGTPGYNSNFWANDLVWEVYDHNNVDQYSAFGQIDIDVTSALHVGIGDRYVKAREKFDEVGAGFFDFGGVGTTGTPFTQSSSFSGSTPKFTATYDLTDLASLYATAAKGFRLGGETTPNTNSLCVQGLATIGIYSSPSSYQPDHVWSYELGSKSLLFQKTLSVNADVYYLDWSNIQQTITIPICGGALNTNIGDAKAIGGELEVRFKPPVINGLTVGVNLGGEHAYVTSTVDAMTAAVGQDILYTPKFTATVLADYTQHLTDSIIGFVRGDFAYTGESYGSFQVGTPGYIDPAYSVVNLNVGVDIQTFQIAVYAKNLFDNRTILQEPTVNSVLEGYTLRPMTIGLTIQTKF
jgi:outer membrane receptor protein involved in Fe transport